MQAWITVVVLMIILLSKTGVLWKKKKRGSSQLSWPLSHVYASPETNLVCLQAADMALCELHISSHRTLKRWLHSQDVMKLVMSTVLSQVFFSGPDIPVTVSRWWWRTQGVLSSLVSLPWQLLRDAGNFTHYCLKSTFKKLRSSSPVIAWQIDGETMATVTDFIFLGSKITADGDCSHERKAMRNLDSALKSRDITLLTNVHLAKAVVFTVVMYGCESWTIKRLSAEELMLSNCGAGEDSFFKKNFFCLVLIEG